MSSFAYKAKDRQGRTVTGVVDADNPSQAASLIRGMGHLPMDIRPVGRGARVARTKEAGSAFARYLVYPIWTGVNIKALVLFYRQLATLIASGMSLSEALRSVCSRTSGRLKRIVTEAHDNVMRGGTLSQTMSRYPRVFSRLQISLVRAGETGGLLEQMIDRIASYLEYELSVRRMIAKAVFYPMLIALFAIVMPHVPTLVLSGTAAFAKSLWASLRLWLPWLVVVALVLKLILQFDTPRFLWDAIKVQPPFIGATARKVAMSRFCRALAALYAAGLSLNETVSAAAEACANLYMGQSIRRALPAIQSGRPLTESLARTRVITPMVLDMLATGEKTGNMDAVLNKVSEYMEEETDATIHKLGILLFVGAILIAALVVGMMVVKFYGGYFGTVIGAGKGG
ncbi:MAG: type II secretion system F family protein [Armatimonadetes bacterium]|nr:type II secretion system F family protein [Armatimonadota bacterium]